MIDTFVYRIGYLSCFAPDQEFLEFCEGLNPRVFATKGRGGEPVIAWLDTDKPPKDGFDEFNYSQPRVRANPATGLLFSCCHEEPYVGVPLGRIHFHQSCAFVSVELPRVVSGGGHNGYLLSIDQAQSALTTHLAALCAQFPMLNQDDIKVIWLDLYYQTCVLYPASTIDCLDRYYHTCVSASGVRYKQLPRKVGGNWVASRDNANHWFNCYDKARQLALVEGFTEIVGTHFGLTRVTERIGRKDAHLEQVYDDRSRFFDPAAIRDIIHTRYADFFQDAEVQNERALVRKYGVAKAAGLCQLALNPMFLTRYCEGVKGSQTDQSIRNLRSKTLREVRENVVVAGRYQPFALPPVEELVERLENRDDPYILPGSGERPISLDELDDIDFAALGET